MSEQTPHPSSSLLSQLEAWMIRNRDKYPLCVRQYPHPRAACDFHEDCTGCLIEHAALELRKRALSGDSPAPETKEHRCRSCRKVIPWTAGDSPHFCAYCGASSPVETSAHRHTDECWEPDSGCDMGRNAKFAENGETERG